MPPEELLEAGVLIYLRGLGLPTERGRGSRLTLLIRYLRRA